MAAFKTPKVCRLEIKKPITAEMPAFGKAPIVAAKSEAVKNFQKSSANLGNISKAQKDVDEEKQVIEGFLNKSERKKEALERATFIANLDKDLITSPNMSPRPKNELGKFTES